MTQGEEFEQCLCIIDSFPPSESNLQTDKTALKSGLFLWLQVSHCPADMLHTDVSLSEGTPSAFLTIDSEQVANM